MNKISEKDRQTKTYIKFSHKNNIIYLGFYIPCNKELNDDNNQNIAYYHKNRIHRVVVF